MNKLIIGYYVKTSRPILDKRNLVSDYIFVNDKIKVDDFKIIDSDVSNCLPLQLDLDI